MTLLEVKNVSLHYGAVKAVNDVSLAVPAGEVRAVIGPNGAGKSTLFSVMGGRATPTAGEVRFDGKSLRGVAPHRVIERGIGVTFQVARLFDGLALHENVMAAVLTKSGKPRSMWRRVSRMKEAHRRTDELLELVGLADMRGMDSATLSHGDRKTLEIAIALAGEPRLLLLDEPTAGMSVSERQAVVGLLRRLGKDLGMTIVFTEHDVDMVLSFADRITCMVRGSVLAEGSPDEIRANPDVQAAYLGHSVKGANDGVA